jgi:hypothetical protein
VNATTTGRSCPLPWCTADHTNDTPEVARHSANIGDHTGPGATVSVDIRWGERANGRSILPHLYISFVGEKEVGTIDLTPREATAWSHLLAGIAPEGFTDPLAEMLATGARILEEYEDREHDGEDHYVTEDAPQRTGNERFTWALIRDVFSVFEQHGYQRSDDRQTGRAIGMLFDLVDAYEGSAR